MSSPRRGLYQDAIRKPILLEFACPDGTQVGSGVSEVQAAFVTSLATMQGSLAHRHCGEESSAFDESGVDQRPPDLANVRFWLIPKPGVAVSVFNRRLVLLGIVLFQPEQLVNRVHSPLHDVLHLVLRYVGVFDLASTIGALFSCVNIFDGAVAECQCDTAPGLYRHSSAPH